jgi:hypothetical protein
MQLEKIKDRILEIRVKKPLTNDNHLLKLNTSNYYPLTCNASNFLLFLPLFQKQK